MNKDFNKYITNINPVTWLRTAIYALLLFLLYRSTFSYLFSKWNSDEFTYCYIIPFIVLYMIWEKRETLSHIPSVPSWAGFIPITIGIVCYWLGELGGEFTILFISSWLVVVGLCWLHMGWQKLKAISFPLFFGLGMFVPPNAIYTPLSLKLKLISSQIGVYMLQLYGMSAFREGNIIDLGFTQLQVVDACNGLRYLIPLFMMGMLMAYYFRAPMWKKLFLVASTIPLSIFTNSLRIASVGILYQLMGADAAEGFFHEFSGWFIFMATLGFLMAEMLVLKKIFREQGTRSSEQGSSSTHASVNPKEASRGVASFFTPHHFAVAAIALSATVAVGQSVDFHEKTPLAKSLSGFPLQVGEWSGIRTDMEQKFLDSLHLDDYLLIDFRNPQGKLISLYVAYYASQLKGESIHSPATCLPGGGWVFEESGPAQLPLNGASSPIMTVRRAFMEKSGERMLVYYWFPQRGRILTGINQLKLYSFWDALTRQRTDGALVRVITPLGSGEDIASAEERLRGFCREAVPLIDRFLPN